MKDTPQARGKRALRNVVLDMALTAGYRRSTRLGLWADQNEMYDRATGALSAMVNHEHPQKQAVLADFYERFKKKPWWWIYGLVYKQVMRMLQLLIDCQRLLSVKTSIGYPQIEFVRW